jgi:hypothetical protein
MCRMIAAWAVLIVASPVLADDKLNTLTPKEIEEGWILLFDGASTFGWEIDGDAEVKDGMLILGMTKKTTAYPTADFGPYYQLKVEWQGDGKATVGMSAFTLGKRFGADWNGLEYEWDGKSVSFRSEGSIKPHELKDGGKVSGIPALKVFTDGQTPAVLRSVKLLPLNPKPLFTGKSLDGWKVNAADPKRMASKFAVTKEGELSVKNGPGDLVTEKEFGDFLLQLECKTLGKGLNSGIFFRCIPGQYQNGYEAQIQNLFKGDDRTKPVDFGTGAIYRRIPTRRVVSNDNEWFTMTVAANGKHIATWVNGYQTVDWMDERPADDNPRKGFRAAKGTISIQGHDPTTDLLFRNIRIAEIPAGK